MHCPYCGKEISENAKVCPYCGREQKKKVQVEKVVEAPPPEAAKPAVETQSEASPKIETAKIEKIKKKEVIAGSKSDATKDDSILPKSPYGMPKWIWAVVGLLVVVLIINLVSGGEQEPPTTESVAVVASGSDESDTQSSTYYPFNDAVGTWEATDTDGSQLVLKVESDGDSWFHIVYLDNEATAVCPGQSVEAEVSAHAYDYNYGPNPMYGTCELGEVFEVSYGLKYLPGSDQIEDSYGVVFDRQ